MQIFKNEKQEPQDMQDYKTPKNQSTSKMLGSIENSLTIFDEFDIKITPELVPEEIIEVASALINFAYPKLRNEKIKG